MIRPLLLLIGGVSAALLLAACDKSGNLDLNVLDNWMPGKPKLEDQWKPSTAITDPVKIYQQNCLGCHSIGETTGPAIALNNPTYLAVIPREALVNVIANGVPGSRMPAFATLKGGSLSPDQINLLVDFILSKKQPVAGPLPPYAAPLGNAVTGQPLYNTYLASIKKTTDPAMFTDGFMTNSYFLSLVSDQYLRSLVIAGTPELGIPNFRDAIPGRPLSDQDIADLVAWLVSNRKNEFGQPISSANP